MQRYSVYLLATLLLIAPACNRSTTAAQGRTAEAYVPDSGSVGFDIEPSESGNGSLRLKATYTSQGRTAKFQIEFGPAKTLGAKDSKDFPMKDFPMKVGEGRFVAEPGSDASVLLLDLKKALEAKALPSKVQRLDNLPFTFVNIGENLSQGASGGFNAAPPGNWTAIKIFIGDGEQEAEVFLNINAVIRKGQFSIKDAEYGDLALAQLAKVL
ncbi:MAG TPA: hypothetical protein VN310_00325 [Candidatus Dormibacteraeota bacterium]|jgi:hypothetical protein|nr:hypothetical protein [Candidatus Dormibacteraeota bacterium]